MKQSELRRQRAILVRLSACLANGDPEELTQVLRDGAEAGAFAQVEEVILQSYLFLGYPAALNAFALWREVAGVEPGQGVSDDWEAWRVRGEDVCRRVYGGQYDGLRRNVKFLHPDMERWMVVEGYGKVLGRPGLDLATRELCISALLAVLGTSRQLYSHLRGALNTGAETSEVEEALAMACRYLDETDATEVWSVWARVRDRTQAFTVP
jgi:4-carboxymuconolactone decarboxylase